MVELSRMSGNYNIRHGIVILLFNVPFYDEPECSDTLIGTASVVAAASEAQAAAALSCINPDEFVRKVDVLLAPVQALKRIDALQSFSCVSIDASLVKITAETSERYRISHGDDVIMAAAESLNVTTIYSEEMNHGQHHGSIPKNSSGANFCASPEVFRQSPQALLHNSPVDLAEFLWDTRRAGKIA